MFTHLHIVSFDVPYPDNYGGVIDVFHKIRLLKEHGIKVILHCYEYGRGEQEILHKLCEKVYYYKRDLNLKKIFSLKPYIVCTRSSLSLLQNLLIDKHPILFEALHSCYYIDSPFLQNRIKIYRESNIEHLYYKELARNEKKIFNKIFFLLESLKLKFFEKKIISSNLILAVSEEDKDYFKKNYPQTESLFLPSFHPFDEIEISPIRGDFILYHGKLSVNENHHAALHLVKNIFSKTNLQVIIAGSNPKEELKDEIKKHPNIKLMINPSSETMQSLIGSAQINCFYTDQETGLKLKLLIALFKGKFVICNKKMVYGTNLDSSLIIAESDEDMLSLINQCFLMEFDEDQILKRKKNIPIEYDNFRKVELLIKKINSLTDQTIVQ